MLIAHILSLEIACVLNWRNRENDEFLIKEFLSDEFQDRCLLYRFGCPETLSVDKTGLKLTEIPLPLPLKCWD